MKTSYKYLLPIAAVAVIATGAYGAQKASAATNTAGQQSLADRLVQTFGLDKAKVQAVIDANRTAHSADREAAYEARLTQGVTDGKITAAQKSLILAEHQKLKSERTANQADATAKTQAQRQADRAAVQAEIDAWAKANNIDASWLGGPGAGGRGHGGMDRGMMDNDGR